MTPWSATVPRHYLLRTSWVIGEGKNFVATMASLADRGIAPSVVADQFGRLTFTDEIVAAIDHLLAVEAPYGTYNVSNGGPVTSWAEVAKAVYAGRGQDPAAVTEVTAEAYGARQGPGPAAAAQRPRPDQDHRDGVRASAGSGSAGGVPARSALTRRRPVDGPESPHAVDRRSSPYAQRGHDQDQPGPDHAVEAGLGPARVDHLTQRGGAQSDPSGHAHRGPARAPR